MTLGNFLGQIAIQRPNNCTAKSQQITQRIAAHVFQHLRRRPAALAAHDPANAEQGQQQPRQQPPLGFLPIKHQGHQHGETGPQVVDHSHFNRLQTGIGIAQRQRQADFIADKQQAAEEQVGAWEQA
ncbi:hypothetical protein D3C71_1505400 [compost metagenome]